MTDLSTGLYAFGSIVSALLHRSQTGKGQHIDCNLLSTQVYTLYVFRRYLKLDIPYIAFSRSVIVSSNGFKPYCLAVTRLYSLGILT